ncbi:polysaccharide deacetylase family protein [Subtercola boreus]|uniref:Polysaccharide deacetylase n=1 Tax=Subtercola boreus TaxID=120213 RepID=A0A3E0W6L4_9MICO|nr:polysaccharide deacetylase family protein [Subtercola boreus]RFA18164.1 polysaccharide deacetylase [Subtercola boreus]RFA18546.1 polysaccharide deacetylase [Subtercola boreus]RFA25074.1 polysaccharide deacetylase [Subtercola boreus]
MSSLNTHDRYDYAPVADRAQAPWPDGKKLAVYVAVGIEDYHFGDGHVENLLDGVPAPDLVNASWRDYGNRVGAFRLLRRLETFGIAPTILLNTAVYDSAPELVALARRLGSEIVGHGVSNSDSLAGLGEAEERAYLDEVADRIEREEGARPTGWSSPWLTHTESTLDLLAEAGYRYVMDLRLDDQPVWLNTRNAPLLAMPYGLELNDSTSMIGRGVAPSEFADMIIDEFDELLAAAREEGQPLVMSIIVHSFISGVPFRLKQLTRALEHIAAYSDDVWLTQPRRIYEAVTHGHID